MNIIEIYNIGASLSDFHRAYVKSLYQFSEKQVSVTCYFYSFGPELKAP